MLTVSLSVISKKSGAIERTEWNLEIYGCAPLFSLWLARLGGHPPQVENPGKQGLT